MMMKVEIISREIITPFSPTPSNLTTHKLSFLDQLAPPVFVPIILFYHQHNNIISSTEQLHNRLKESLSKCLTTFYPLAGRLKDDIFVDCNDAGVDYLSAKVTNCDLSDLINRPDIDALKQLLPCEPYDPESTKSEPVLLAVQVNKFECGGIAIGVCISHKVADASSLTTFVNGWSSTARDDDELVAINPRFDLASVFPWRDLKGFKASTGIRKEKIVAKRFVFNSSNIAALREKLLAGNPTRVETVSAFLSKRFIDLDRISKDNSKPYGALYAMNLRKRRDPPLPEQSFGNMYSIAIAPLTMDDGKEINMESMVGRIRGAIRGVDGEYVRKVESGGDWYLDSIKAEAVRVFKEEIVLIHFSSWCRFALYDADFGWGKPVWVSTTTMPFKNVVILMDTRSGDGIEAWVNMLEGDMAEFERDHEILTFTSESTTNV